MDIDSLFKAPKVPLSGNKRKLPDNPTPEMLKRLRTEETSSTSANAVMANGTSRKDKVQAVTIQEVPDDEDHDQSFAPGGDADYFAEEDEDGRFFGGGLTDEQKQILNIFDEAGEHTGGDAEELNLPGIRRMLLKFDRAAKKNQDQRSKFSDDPTRFIDSEADLDVAIKSLLPLAQAPSIAYPELVKSGGLAKLVDLLSHENVDIVIDVVEVLHELTDEDVGDAEEEDDEEVGKKKSNALKLLIDGLLEHSTLELLVDTLNRMNEAEESDRQGIYHTLGIFENSIGFSPELASVLVGKTSILNWLLDRIQSKKHDENRNYVSELLAILLQNNKENILRFGKEKGVDTLLRVLSQFRKKDPVDAEEIEFMENVFDTLCSALSESQVKKLFLDDEGVELMVLMMREKKLSRSRSIKVLDYAMSGPAGSANCEQFVEALGLKSLFSALMQKGKGKGKSGITPASEDTSHVLGILSSLFSNLASDSPPRIRLLSKFVENDYEKVDRLLELREFHSARLAATDVEIEAEKKELIAEDEMDLAENEDVWYLRRLDGGLFTLQAVDYILGWILMEDDGVLTHATTMLERKNQSINNIVDTLKVYHDSIDGPTEEDASSQGDAPSQKEILRALIGFLDSY